MHRDPQSISDRVSAALRRRQAAGAPLVAALERSLPDLRDLLRERYGVVRVWLVGSYARGTPTADSDVDLAVEGLSARDHFRAAALLSDVLARRVDLVPVEALDERSREQLLEDAVLL